MIRITSNINEYMRLIQQTPGAMADGLESALDDIKKDWHTEAREIAPIDKGDLRQQIKSQASNTGLDGTVVIESNARSSSGFNYAYYIHEGHMAADGKRLRTPGTVEKYLEESAEQRKGEWVEWIEDDVEHELRRKGW